MRNTKITDPPTFYLTYMKYEKKFFFEVEEPYCNT